MAGRGVLGCTGALVAIVTALVAGWLVLELLLTVGAGSWRADVLVHQIGQLLVFTTLVWTILAVVMRPEAVRARFAALRALLWVGAGLELLAWWLLPAGSRVAIWALVLAAVGALAPWLIARAFFGASASDRRGEGEEGDDRGSR